MPTVSNKNSAPPKLEDRKKNFSSCCLGLFSARKWSQEGTGFSAASFAFWSPAGVEAVASWLSSDRNSGMFFNSVVQEAALLSYHQTLAELTVPLVSQVHSV